MPVVALSGIRAQTAPATTATAPSTQPQSLDAVENGKSKVQFAFWQGDKRCLPDKDGVVHLKPQAFEIRFTGSVNDVLVMASSSPKTADALEKAKGPVVACNAMGAAYEDGELLIEDGAKVLKWEQERPDGFPKERVAEFSKLFSDRFHQMPTILQGGYQPLHTDEGASAYTMKVKKILGGDLKTTKELSVLVILQQYIDDLTPITRDPRYRSWNATFLDIRWRRIKLVFDQ